MGHNKTHINTIVDVIYNFHKKIKELRKLNYLEIKKETGIALNSNIERDNLLDDYEIGLNYVLTKRNADQIAESIGSQIADYLNEFDLSNIQNRMLTGGTSPEELSEVMDEVEKKYETLSYEERVTSITATSMISHGVDVNRFNFMTFFGIPRQTAEYIQASSRIGRKLPGISIIIFAPQKERDQSYFKYFYKYHEYLERLVEVPAINRWAKFSINKTFPGILFGVILNKYNRLEGKNFYFADVFKQYLDSFSYQERKEIQNELTNILMDSYAVKLMDGNMFGKRIEENINIFFQSIRRIRNKKMIDFIEHLFGNRPMLSLRDTEEEKSFFKSNELESYTEKTSL